jgi:hypothetical protein
MADDDETKKESSGTSGDIRGLLRQLVSPVVEQIDDRVNKQIDSEVTARIDELLSTRMATVDRAIGDLDRHLSELSARLDRIEKNSHTPNDDATPES